jgi:hypothetical protein
LLGNHLSGCHELATRGQQRLNKPGKATWVASLA